MTLDYVKLTTAGITICSILHTVLPPWEAFNDFPTGQKYYRLFVYIVGYAALNGRSTVYPSLSTANGSKTSKVVNGGPNDLAQKAGLDPGKGGNGSGGVGGAGTNPNPPAG